MLNSGTNPNGGHAPVRNIRGGKRIKEKLDYQLRDRLLKDADNQRMLDGIGRQHDNGRVRLFRERPEI